MGVGLQVGRVISEIGTSDFFHSFFSTISGNLEPEGWGSRFPTLMHKLYAGELAQPYAATALRELYEARHELSRLPIERVIWDIEDRSKMPPWGNDVANTVSDLSNYFVTSTGRDLISTVREVIQELRDSGGIAKVVSY